MPLAWDLVDTVLFIDTANPDFERAGPITST
jgi:hypothetical protein